jgi:hypothetical protein
MLELFSFGVLWQGRRAMLGCPPFVGLSIFLSFS